MTPVLALFVLQYTLCLTIRVPVEWNDKSEVQNNQFKDENEDPVQTFTPHDVQKKPIPKEYFEYTAKKPQFASDIAAFHGVKSPEYHFKAYPVKPHTGIKKPELGKHNIFDKGKPLFAPYRQFVNKNKHLSYVTPATSNYKIFHPYKSEEPALKAIYKDPVLEKIRNDLKDSKNRLQQYENDAGESSIEKNEYLESPQETDRKHFSGRHVPAQFEIHRPQRRPIYYMPPITYSNRDHILNQKIRHPWSQNYAKVTPNHYRPIKNHLHTLRQNHAIKFNDENNEYPQIQPHSGYEEKPDGYDIYEEGKDKFKKLRNNVDESINDAVKKNSQSTHDKLELQSTENDNENIQDDYEFSPVKNYAQVRKFETIRHLPRDAAFKDAETYDDLRNAHRLREAIKSTKAQTVYSEEGYEDSAYDHAGEQKHASDHEGHGGYLKEKELSKGKYKIPSFNGSYEDGQGSIYRDNVLHGKKWKNHNKDDEENKEEEDYSEDENEYYIESENSSTNKPTNEISNNQFHTTEDSLNSYNIHETDPQHDLSKREISFTVPEINIQSTYLNEDEILNISSTKLKPFKLKDLSGKYPYYNTSLDEINKDSPLRYAENLKNIPRKWKGGTEFYDSRTQFECSEVEDNVDPIPEKLKKGGHLDENDNSDADNDNQNSNENNDLRNMNEKPRLKGLGDKIDCFKIKYFGENPLDSPFFEEDIIPNPEPVTAPTFNIFKLFNQLDQQLPQESQINSLNLIPVIKTESNNAEEYKNNNNEKISQLMGTYIELFEAPVSNDTLRNKKENINTNTNVNHTKNQRLNETNDKQLISTRKIRATPFIYEPYKIIRDSQIQDSKKTTTTSNISPLIKQLQSSRIVEKVTTNFNKDQPIKRNTGSLIYKNINRKDREKSLDKTENELSNTTFVDVNEKLRLIEPRFETRPSNHKSLYTPVESKKSMSLEIYKNRTKSNNINSGRDTGNKASGRPYFDVSKYLPESLELQKPEPSNRVKRIKEISKYDLASAQKQISMPSHSEENVESDEDYEEYDGEDEEEEITTTTTTKPNIRKRIRIVATTKRPQNKENIDEQLPKLRLITKFRNSTTNNDKSRKQKIPTSAIKENENHDDMTIPKFREKKKKSSQSTLVTDTKRYGEGNDDMRKDEVDSLIGVEHDVEEYVPQYEKEIESEDSLRENESRSSEDVREDDDVDDNDDEGDDESDDNDDDEDDDEDDVEDDDDDDDDEAGDNRTEDEKKRFDETSTTTAEPTKRTLLKTTEAPQMTTESSKSKLEIKPIISKKKIEIHKELPFSKSSPNITQFKQDFTEVEIIKEMPEVSHVTPQKTAEILQMYKDGNLAKEVNNFFDVEVFKGDLNLKKGPRHGGNYRSINSSKIDDSIVPGKMVYNKNSNISKQDSESSQSETSKLTEQSYKKSKRRRGGENSESTTQPSRRSRGQNPKLGSSQAIPVKRVQSGNSKLNQDHSREAGEEKNAKLIELSEENDYNDKENADENVHGNFETYSSSRSTGQPIHGGNYKSTRITQSDENDKEGLEPNINNRKKDTSKNFRRNSAALLNSFVHAVPILTTTPAYILDPSKRMYYYVDS